MRENLWKIIKKTHISGQTTGSRGPYHGVDNGFEFSPFILVQKVASDEDLLEEVIDNSWIQVN
jgi:hypothetical protein